MKPRARPTTSNSISSPAVSSDVRRNSTLTPSADKSSTAPGLTMILLDDRLPGASPPSYVRHMIADHRAGSERARPPGAPAGRPLRQLGSAPATEQLAARRAARERRRVDVRVV